MAGIKDPSSQGAPLKIKPLPHSLVFFCLGWRQADGNFNWWTKEKFTLSKHGYCCCVSWHCQMKNRECYDIIKLPLQVNTDDIIAVLKGVTANVSYPELTACCTQSPLRRASARTPPGFGSARLQLCQMPVKQINKARLSIMIKQFFYNFKRSLATRTRSSSSSLFFLPSDWFL